MSALAEIRSSDSVLALGYSAKEHSLLEIGNRIAFPNGIIHVRSAEPPSVPAKNHTGPL